MSRKESITLLNWITVGTGEQYPTCGDNRTWAVKCLESGEEHTNRQIQLDCHRLQCPIDFDKEVWRRSKKAAEKLEAVQLAYYKDGITLDFVEAIIYPPKEKRESYFGTQEGYEEFTHQINQLMVDFGIVGGIRFVHTTAVNRNEGATYKEYELYRKGLPCRVRYNPHIQAVGLRKENWGMDRAYTEQKRQERHNKRDKMAAWRERGWFVRILYADGRTENKPWKSVARKISYELGHADMGVSEFGTKKQFTVWYGICAYNNVKIDEHIREEVEKCKCGRDCWLFYEDERRELATYKHVERVFNITHESIDRAVLKHKLERGIRRFEEITAYA